MTLQHEQSPISPDAAQVAAAIGEILKGASPEDRSEFVDDLNEGLVPQNLHVTDEQDDRVSP